jgi:hypothetical protein
VIGCLLWYSNSDTTGIVTCLYFNFILYFHQITRQFQSILSQLIFVHTFQILGRSIWVISLLSYVTIYSDKQTMMCKLILYFHEMYLNILFFETLLSGLIHISFSASFVVVFIVSERWRVRVMVFNASWLFLYGSWIYNYLCNHCRSPLTLWVQILLRRGVLDTTL